MLLGVLTCTYGPPLQTVSLHFLAAGGPFPSFGAWAAQRLRSFVPEGTSLTGTLPAAWSQLK